MTNRRRTIVVVVALLCAVFVSSPLHLPLNNPNEGVRVFSVKALVEQHTFAIDDVVRDWGYIDDKAEKDGHLFQSKAPFVALVAAAGYAVVHVVTGPLDRLDLTRLCRLVGGVVPVALALAVAWWALRRERRRDDDDHADEHAFLVDLVAVAVVVASGVLASLHVFSGHALAAIAPLVVIALSRLPTVTTSALVVAGAVLSAATCAEYPAAIALPLALLVVRRHEAPRRALVVVVVSAFVVAIPTMLAHTAMFGAPWRTGYSFLENAGYRPLVAGTFFGIGAPDVKVLGTVLFSPSIGLFFGAPWLLLGLVGLVRRRRQQLDDRFDTAVVVVVIVGFLLFIAGFRGWRGGWSVGPRYVLELIGLLAAFVVDGARALPAKVRHVVVVGLVAVGVLQCGLAGAFFPHLPDILAWPVGSLLLPLIARGFAPDSLPLLLGLSSTVSAYLIVVVVFASVVAVGLAWRRREIIAVLIVVPLAWFQVFAAPVSARAALETRRISETWRPLQGVPYDADTAIDDVATRLAIGRGRVAREPRLRCDPVARPQRIDVGPLSGIVERAQGLVPADALLVVDDVLADRLGPAGGAALAMTFNDVDFRGTLPLPCTGDVFVVVGATKLPKSMRTMQTTGDDVELGHGFVLRRLRRLAT